MSIEISLKKLENLHEDISKDLSESERKLSQAKRLLERMEAETTAKRFFKSAVERMMEIKQKEE